MSGPDSPTGPARPRRGSVSRAGARRLSAGTATNLGQGILSPRLTTWNVPSSVAELAIRIFMKEPQDRNPEECEYAAKYLLKRKLKYFCMFNLAKVVELCKVMHLRMVGQHDVVYKIGGIGENLYVVLEGKVAIMLPETSDDDGPIAHSYMRKRGFVASRDEAERALSIAKQLARIRPSEMVKPRKHEPGSFAASLLSDMDPDPVAEIDMKEMFDAREKWRVAISTVALATAVGAALARKKERVVEISRVGPGGAFGELALDSMARSHRVTARAKSPTMLLCIPRETYAKFHHIRLISQEARDLNNDLAFLKSLPALASASSNGLMKLAFKFRQSRFLRGTLILEEGDTSPVMYVVRSGHCRIECRHTEGDELEATVKKVAKPGGSNAGKTITTTLPLGVIGPGEFFGEECVLLGRAADFSVIADTTVDIVAMSSRDYSYIKKRTFSDLMTSWTQKARHRAGRISQLANAQRKLKSIPTFSYSHAEGEAKHVVHSGVPLKSSGPVQWKLPEPSGCALPKDAAWRRGSEASRSRATTVRSEIVPATEPDGSADVLIGIKHIAQTMSRPGSKLPLKDVLAARRTARLPSSYTAAPSSRGTGEPVFKRGHTPSFSRSHMRNVRSAPALTGSLTSGLEGLSARGEDLRFGAPSGRPHTSAGLSTPPKGAAPHDGDPDGRPRTESLKDSLRRFSRVSLQAAARQRQVVKQKEFDGRIQKVMKHTRRLLKKRPPQYNWEDEIQVQRNKSDLTESDRRIMKVISQPLRRRGLTAMGVTMGFK